MGTEPTRPCILLTVALDIALTPPMITALEALSLVICCSACGDNTLPLVNTIGAFKAPASGAAANASGKLSPDATTTYSEVPGTSACTIRLIVSYRVSPARRITLVLLASTLDAGITAVPISAVHRPAIVVHTAIFFKIMAEFLPIETMH